MQRYKTASIRLYITISLVLIGNVAFSQNPLSIPPALTGTTFNLNIQNGTIQFWPGINTPTYGINGNILGPTLIVNKWDWVTMNVTNNLTGFGNSTTIHWHGMHVPAMADGGPHMIIPQGTTWSPNFQILNDAGTFWYHPHGVGKTDLHVARGIAGFLLVKDSAEAQLNLPRTYGIDDFPVVVQTKAFDVLNQIAIATEFDTLVLANATPHAYLDAPAQIIRLRLLNGSSMRVFNFGFTNNHPFKMIASDGGLLDSAITLTRITLAPGERAEILIDLNGMQGQTIFLKSFSSELPNGIYGTANLTGMMGATIPDYDLNPLNGADFDILQLNVVAQTSNPVTTMPTALTVNNPLTSFGSIRAFTLSPVNMNPLDMLIGPFSINGTVFNMNVINETVYINSTEKWRIDNNTSIAHPFHIHDIQFFVDNINGGPVPPQLQGKKDVVLVMPGQYIDVIAKFEDFADDSIPYMYHCHMLHHEDDGMMGSFVVVDTNSSTGIAPISDYSEQGIIAYPNPVHDVLSIKFQNTISNAELTISNVLGEIIHKQKINNTSSTRLDVEAFENGLYFIAIKTSGTNAILKFIKQ